jgi:GATA zinc finger
MATLLQFFSKICFSSETCVTVMTGTPLWRNGPPEKPVLCNACGSRWRTKGSLANYTPLHVREIIESEAIQPVKLRNVAVPVLKTAQFKHQKDIHRVPKKKPNTKPKTLVESNDSFSDQNFKRASEATDWNSNTRSSSYSGSGATYSESCAQYDASDFTGMVASFFDYIPSLIIFIFVNVAFYVSL